MAKSKIIVTTYYNDEKYDDSNSVITEFYADEAGMEIAFLMYALEGYIANIEIFRSKEEKLKECLRTENYRGYYKIIQKMAKQAKEAL